MALCLAVTSNLDGRSKPPSEPLRVCFDQLNARSATLGFHRRLRGTHDQQRTGYPRVSELLARR